MERRGASVQKKFLTFNFKTQGKLLIHSTIDQLVLIRHIGLSYLPLKENECLGGHISCPSLWFLIDSQPMGNPTAASQSPSTGLWALRSHRSTPAASCPEMTHSVYIFWPVISNDINTLWFLYEIAVFDGEVLCNRSTGLESEPESSRPESLCTITRCVSSGTGSVLVWNWPCKGLCLMHRVMRMQWDTLFSMFPKYANSCNDLLWK